MTGGSEAAAWGTGLLGPYKWLRAVGLGPQVGGAPKRDDSRVIGVIRNMIDKRTTEEDRLANQHELAQSGVEHDIQTEASLRAEREAHSDTATIAKISQDLKDKAVADVAGAGRVVARKHGAARIIQVVDFLFSILYVLLAVRLVLDLIGANQESGFVQLIATLTNPFFWFFRDIVQSPTAHGGYTIALPVVIAIAAYMLLHWGVRSLARLIINKRTEI